MAEVHVAVRRGDPERRLYAVKRMLPAVAEDRELARLFHEEARLLAQLRHPGIVAVHECGLQGGRPFIAMDYVAGRTLRALVDRSGGPLPVELSAHVAARVADALDHAHRARGADGAELRVVHRDVSPSNVLLGFDGTVRLADFGIAQAAGGSPGGHVPRGKSGYASPEAIRGGPVDRRSDVFALGAVLRECLAGRRLLEPPAGRAGEPREAPHPPSVANPAVPPELDAVVLRALAREPAARFAWASELRDALAPWDRAAGPAALAALLAEAFPDELRAEEERRARLSSLGAA